eukprot:Skav211267  [mRNA]  locus=scaffold2429:526:2325:+ [translate_table: standard]
MEAKGPRNIVLPRLSPVTRQCRDIGQNPRQIVRQSLQARTKEGRAEKRQAFMQHTVPIPRFKGQTFLEQNAVSREVATDYAVRMKQFRDYAKMNNLPINTIKNLDSSFTEYLNDMFAGGSSLGEATKTLAAVIDHMPDCGQKGALNRSRRALQGWQRLDPGATRPPIPMELVMLVALQMWEAKSRVAAVAVLLMFEGYLRPGEVLRLKEEDLVMPTAIHPYHCLNLHPSDRMETSKVGMCDETIQLDSNLMPWLGDLLTAMITGCPHAPMFPIQYTQLNNCWMRQLVKVGLERNHAVLYQLRHSGPSYDRSTKSRSLQDVKKRGRWATDSSVKRYEAHAKLAQEFQRLPHKVQRAALAAPSTQKDLKCWVIEIFSGSAHLSQAMCQQGFHVAAWDIDYNPGCDVFQESVTRQILSFLASHKVVLVWFGMPCQSWSRARRWDGGPPPLRDDTVFIWGREHMSLSDADKIFLGNRLLCWTFLLVMILNVWHIPWVVENPFTSRAWLTKPFAYLVKNGAQLHQVDYCQYNTPWRKSTGLLSSGFSNLGQCLRCCEPLHGRCSRTHKKHIILSGKDPHGVWWTMRAQPYPKPLCRDIALALAS